MPNICVKLRQREKNKYRKMLTVTESIYTTDALDIATSTPYVPGASLEDGEWFSISHAALQDYSIDLIKQTFESADFDTLDRREFSNVDYIFADLDGTLTFQKVPKTKLVSKKCIIRIGESFEYKDDRQEIEINSIPDAIYIRKTDVLYFKRLEAITSIFRGIDQLYTEATEAETEQFLANDFIQLRDGYSTSNVKTANRKRIALAQKTLSVLDDDSKRNIFNYIGEYCPKLKVSESSFEVGSEDELKMLLYGIEQRFYTTIVGGEKRIANSVVPLEQ